MDRSSRLKVAMTRARNEPWMRRSILGRAGGGGQRAHAIAEDYKCGDDGTVGSIALLDNSADDGTVGNIALPMILIALGKLTRCAPVCLNVALGDAHAPRRAGSREARRLFCNRKTSWASKTNLLDVGNPA